MKTRSFYILAVAGLIISSCESHYYKVEGYTRDFADGDTICLKAASPTFSQLRYTTVASGKFHFAGEADSVMLYEIYASKAPKEGITFFNVAGTTTVELNHKPHHSRVSGTMVNNNWQQLADSIDLYAAMIKHILRRKTNDTLSIRLRAQSIYSLHRQMSDCITHTATRNKHNPLGQYILANYKAPEFR